MNRTNIVIMTVALVVAAVGVAPLGGVAQETTESDTSEAAVAPGEILTGVVGVQGAELESEMDRRTFGIKIARAASDEARADVVAEELDEQQAKLADLKARKQALEQAHENGSISNGTYQAQVAVLAAQTQNIKEMGNATRNVSEHLPAELLESKGINAEAIQTLMDGAEELTGPEVAEIARSIAGPDAGAPVASDNAPSDAGPPVDAGPDSQASSGNGTATETATESPSSPDGEGNQAAGDSGNGY